MFSRLSREFGGPFFCARVWFLFFGILFILWVLLSGNCRTISTLSGCCVLGWLNVLGLVDSEAMGRFRLLNLCFFGGCGWCGEGTLACLCFMSRDQSYACSCFLWIAFDSLDLWPGSTLLDDLSWHLDFVYFLVPSPFFNGFWAILWAFFVGIQIWSLFPMHSVRQSLEDKNSYICGLLPLFWASFFYLQFVSPCLVSVFWALIDLSSPHPCFCFCFLLQFHGCWWETLGLVDCLALCMWGQTSLLTTSQWLLTLFLTKSSFVLG